MFDIWGRAQARDTERDRRPVFRFARLGAGKVEPETPPGYRQPAGFLQESIDLGPTPETVFHRPFRYLWNSRRGSIAPLMHN